MSPLHREILWFSLLLTWLNLLPLGAVGMSKTEEKKINYSIKVKAAIPALVA
jgi:hypothetical protein